MQIIRRVDRLTDLNRYFCEERVCQSESLNIQEKECLIKAREFGSNSVTRLAL